VPEHSQLWVLARCPKGEIDDTDHGSAGFGSIGTPRSTNVSAIAQLTYLVSRRRRVQGWQLARDLSIAGASVLFSLWVTFASGYQVVYQALVVILVGLVLYAFLNARRQRLGEATEPTDFTTEAPATELVGSE
jgi:hypothetical protein